MVLRRLIVDSQDSNALTPAANAPLFGSGGELHGQFQYDAVSGIDLHGAFSPFKHFGIQAGMSFLPWNDEDARESERYYGELGAGAYIPFGIGRFEVFAGGGYGQALGRMDFNYEGEKYYSDGKYGRIYVQADIGLWGSGGEDVEEAPPKSDDADDGSKSQNIVSRLW